MAQDYIKQMIGIHLEIERSKISREKSLLVLNKGFFIYVLVLFIAGVGLVNHFVTVQSLNIIIILGIIMLIAGVMPYMLTIAREEKRIQGLIDKFNKSR